MRRSRLESLIVELAEVTANSRILAHMAVDHQALLSAPAVLPRYPCHNASTGGASQTGDHALREVVATGNRLHEFLAYD
jgi:hypothetical protein